MAVENNNDVRLMKGNEALAEAALRAGMKAYFGYPITPQSEILEYLTVEAPKHPGVVILQAESELAAINMVYGAAGAGARTMISSSSPGISLMQEGLSYIATAELPMVIVNVQRGGPGLGTIQPSQADYFQAVKGGGHGDYHLIVLAPSSVQEMVDFMFEGFRLAEKYRNPVMILADGALGQMMEKVTLPPAGSLPVVNAPWATTGKLHTRERNILTSLFIQSEV
ncbi:MAG TPA: 3-methyl-2-oxobutanoate dehydrogenase subunit beta, partial [Bacteroidota bacterium]|nr:3-methyl-2-oxobutanoate dehydrogenase subunit beta [Bacteroidota bacterium]